jgi:plasmid stabilization system protein ParE
MNNTYNISPQALSDLQEIWLYIAQDNPLYADKVEAEIYFEFENLAKHPNIGHKRSDLTDKPVLFWNLYSYQIIYSADIKPLQILRILSGYRDITNILTEE